MTGRHLKILGLSLLALVGVMAVSASAAQAKWLLLKGGVAVSDLKLKGTLGLSELLVAEPTIKIHCKDGTFTALLKTLEGGVEKVDGTVLDGSGTAIFLECVLLDAKTCTVKSPGAKAGEIVAKGEGTGAMAGEETYALLTSTNFVTIVIEGALCPLNETEEPVSGSVKLTINNPTTSAQKHTGTLVEEGLKFGENVATLHGELLAGEVHDKFILGEAEEESGATWAIDLTGL